MKRFTAVPFTTESESGLLSSSGVAKFSRAGIVLEFEKKILGLISRGVKEIRLSVGEILDVKFRRGFLKFGSQIEIRVHSYESLFKMPNHGGLVKLKIVRNDFERARDAVERMQDHLSGKSQNLRPHNSRVSVLFDQSEEET